MTTRTYTPSLRDIERRWFVVDAKGQTLGRLATQVAGLLAGKHKPEYATHLDTGDHVIVINASGVTVNGDKLAAKVYARHSGYPGGFRQETLGDLLARRPEEVIRRAVKGMLPRNRLGVQQLRKLKVYAGADHPHEAQQPVGTDGKPAAEKRVVAHKASAAVAVDDAPATDETPTTPNETATEAAGESAPAAPEGESAE